MWTSILYMFIKNLQMLFSSSNNSYYMNIIKYKIKPKQIVSLARLIITSTKFLIFCIFLYVICSWRIFMLKNCPWMHEYTQSINHLKYYSTMLLNHTLNSHALVIRILLSVYIIENLSAEVNWLFRVYH